MTNSADIHKNQKEPDAAFLQWEQQINASREMVFGLQLLVECMGILGAADETRAAAARGKFTPFIKQIKDNLQRAERLLNEAKEKGDPSGLPAFPPSPLNADPQGEAISRRAMQIADIYRKNFSERPQDRPLTQTEAMQLIDKTVAEI